MTFIRSFEDYAPPPRYDGVPFTHALIQESLELTKGFATIETITLEPVDADPANPVTRDLTTNGATLAVGWYRIIWEDSAGSQFVGEPERFPAAATSDLTTIAAVRLFLQKASADVAQDEVIQSLITSASAQITRRTERQFLPDDGASRLFEMAIIPSGATTVPLTNFAPYELRSVDSIEIDTDTASPSELSVEEFRLWPRPAVDETFLGVRINPITAPPAAGRWGLRREITVTGDWGMTQVPPDVEQAVITTVAIWLRRDVSAFEAGMNIETGYLERPRSLPSAVATALDEGWKRRAGGP